MRIFMTGIDHSRASLDQRQIFSFTKDEIPEALKKIKSAEGITGAVIISTCNRTEIWYSSDREETDPEYGFSILCSIKNADEKENRNAAFIREGRDAIEHLMITACGINSRVFGEDQIITQIKDALTDAREAGCCGKTLDKVFSDSIAAAKKVKSAVRLTSHHPSVADSGVKELEGICGDLTGKRCLIIGNGQMAALIGEHLVSAGAHVTMTLRRKYHTGEESRSLVPEGCHMISYDDRYEALEDADFVISATLSPHYTLSLEGLEGHRFREPGFWLDLAVPRDIEPEIAEKHDITIFDIDSLGNDGAKELMSEEIAKAEKIIGTYRDDIVSWIEFRRQVEKVRKIITLTKKDALLRAEGKFEKLGLDDERLQAVGDIMESATGRAVNKLLFGLRDTLAEEHWEAVFEGLLRSAEKDTLKS